MPFYHALVRPGLGSPDARRAFANDVVDIHCGVTGAPRSFVHVLYTDDHRGSLGADQSCSIRGTIRAGRADEQKNEIVEGLRRAFADRTGVDVGSVTAGTTDIEASFTMEGGKLLPEPGSADEELWKATDDQTASA